MRIPTTPSPALACAAVAFLASCGKEASLPNPPIPPEPVIELLEVRPDVVTAFEDSVVFELRYTDGDGDLGFAEADSAVVYLTDERFPLTEAFHVPPMAPGGEPVAVTGVWSVVLPRTILEDPAAAQESAVFSLRIRDRAGNWSNTVQSGEVTVIAP